ncbi:hypothetical protein OROHE_001147 [Orobanche hederae]
MEQDLISVCRIDSSKETKLIRIRVQWIWFVPRNDNPDDFYSMQMILCDEEKNTKIQASVPRAQIGKISQTMKEGFLYGLQNYTAGQNVDDFLCTSHPYRLGFHRYTTVKPCPCLEIPRYGFQFVTFEKINEGAMDLKLSVDVIGQMIGASELVDISKKGGGNTKRQTIHLRNAQNSILICTLWGKYAEEISKYLTREEPIVVIMQFARLKKWNDEWTVGNSFNSTRLLIDSDIDEVLEFKKSMLSATMTPMKSLSRIESQSVSTILSELAEESDMKDLIELVGIDKASKWVVVATIDRLQSRFGWYYNSCHKCLRKAEEIGGEIRCRKCKNTNIVPRGELYYMSLLLHHKKGPRSHAEIRTIGTIEFPTFKEACYSVGLLDDDKEYIDGIKEASFWGSPHYIRNLFAVLLLANNISRPEYVWENTWQLLGDDILHRQRTLLGISDLQLSDEQIKNFTLVEIEKLLYRNGSSLTKFSSIPFPDMNVVVEGQNKLIQEELRYDQKMMEAEHRKLFSSLTDEQRVIHDKILNAVENDKGGLFFVYGYGGTGKTFVWNTLSAAIRAKGEIVLNVASSGIVALLLPGGRTAHSRFGIPFVVHENSDCSIAAGSELAELIIKSKLIIWDEAPMMNKYCFHALDKSLKAIMQGNIAKKDQLPFGGEVVVLGGDFRQILPVIPKGSREDIVFSTINSSELWNHCSVMKLTKNMRLTTGSDQCHTNPIELKEFSEWILKVGDGDVGTSSDGESITEIPEEFLITHTGDPIEAVVHNTYPSLTDKYSDPQYLQDRAILAPTQTVVEAVNDHIINLLPGDITEYMSADGLSSSNGNCDVNQQVYSTDFLNTIRCSGVPNHKLGLKVGVPVMLLRNIDQANGLCNGTRLVITQLGKHVIEAKTLSGKNVGDKVYIPRMNLSPSDSRLSFKFERKQFPLLVCFATTINKSQGQSLEYVGLFLPKSVFTHGQLYMAISRVKKKWTQDSLS